MPNQQDAFPAHYANIFNAETTGYLQAKKKNWFLRCLKKVKDGLMAGGRKFNETLIFENWDRIPYPGKEKIRRWQLRRKEERDRQG
jgi:hypothetical protein